MKPVDFLDAVTGLHALIIPEGGRYNDEN